MDAVRQIPIVHGGEVALCFFKGLVVPAHDLFISHDGLRLARQLLLEVSCYYVNANVLIVTARECACSSMAHRRKEGRGLRWFFCMRKGA